MGFFQQLKRHFGQKIEQKSQVFSFSLGLVNDFRFSNLSNFFSLRIGLFYKVFIELATEAEATVETLGIKEIVFFFFVEP